MVMIKNRKGWIRIVEAIVAVLIILGVILIVLSKGGVQKEDISEKVYRAEYVILREVELNESLRGEVLSAGPLPIDWLNFDPGLTNVKNKITEKTPGYLECEGRVCWLNQTCTTDAYSGKDVYSKSISITTTLQIYSPRQLKL